MSLLTICQDAADEIQQGRPGSIVGNGDPGSQRFLRYANKVGKRLMTQAAWQALRTEVTFTAVAGEAQPGILPSDFNRFVPETFWNRSDRVLLAGPISPAQWNGLKALTYGAVDAPKFIYRGNAVSVIPAFGGGEACAFEYVSRNWVDTTGDGNGDAASWQADTNTTVLDDELMVYGIAFEWLASESLESAGPMLGQYVTHFNLLLGNDQPSADVLAAGDIFAPSSARHFQGAPPTDGMQSIR